MQKFLLRMVKSDNLITMNLWISIPLFGALGSLARWRLDRLITYWGQPAWVGTLTVNIIGSFLAGFIFQYFSLKYINSDEYRVALLTGFCGGFTTFSALALQLTQMKNENMPLALGYAAGSIILGVGAALLGIYAGSLR